MIKKFIWPIRVFAETYSCNGKKRKINAWVEGAGNAKQAMKNYINRKKNSWEWIGVEIAGVTPLGQKIYIVYDEDIM